MSIRAPDQNDAAIGSRIRAARLLRGLSQQELGIRLGITGAQLGKYESGKSRIAVTRLSDIADGLRLPVTALLT